MSQSATQLAGVHPKSNFDAAGASGLYDSSRPSYPLSLVDRIFQALPTKQADVLELGAGTGIFSRLLLARDELKSLKCLEPSQGMRAGFKDAVIDKLPANCSVPVSIEPGTFTQTNAPDNSADLIVIAQAFHWIGREKKDHEAAMAEFSRVLKPGGVLAFIWNLEQWKQEGWPKRVYELVEGAEVASGTPQYRFGYWRPIFETPAYKESFQSPFEAGAGHDKKTIYRAEDVTHEILVNRLWSKSYIAALPEKERRDLSVNIKRVLEEEKDNVKWVNESQGLFEQPFQTDLYLFQRK